MDQSDIKIFSHGSCIGGHVGTTAVLYKNREEKSCVRLYMCTEDEHTVFKVELAGASIGTKLLNQVTGRKYMIRPDNQAAIQTTRMLEFGLRKVTRHPMWTYPI